MTRSFTPVDSVHRLVKEALDSGAAASLAEAETMFRGFDLRFSIGETEAHDPYHQVALLTGVALARRVFLGGVTVSGALANPLAIPLPLGATLADAVTALGGVTRDQDMGSPLVTVGGGPRSRSQGFHIRTVHAGWRGGIVPAHTETGPTEGPPMPLSPMLAAALAVNEAFFFARTGNTAAGRRPLGLSLWNPSSQVDWLTETAGEPELRYLPARLWLIGLGHLGQAYLWGLGLLPYADPDGLTLVLQDVDVITPSSESTSILTTPAQIGRKKTRALAAWAERRGFTTAIYERLFDGNFTRQADEPSIALCGLDNGLGRRALDRVGFDFVVEAGLGRGYRDFRTMRLHTLPAPRSAAEIWKVDDPGENVEERLAYQNMLKDGSLDRCGITLLAGKAVGAPFVGAVASCLVLSEVLRLLHGGPIYQVIDVNLQSIEHRSTVPHDYDFRRLNPGYVDAIGAERCVEYNAVGICQ
jgi:hypothetical protein